MGDRVLMQCHLDGTKWGPVVYGHWAGSDAPNIVERLRTRMQGRFGDLDYASARLVQEVIDVSASQRAGNTGVGLWNADELLDPDSSHGDAGCVLINVRDFSALYFGGYLAVDGTAYTPTEQQSNYFYERLGAAKL